MLLKSIHFYIFRSEGVVENLILKGIRTNVLNEDYLKNKLDKYIILELNAITVLDEKVHMPLIKYYFDLI